MTKREEALIDREIHQATDEVLAEIRKYLDFSAVIIKDRVKRNYSRKQRAQNANGNHRLRRKNSNVVEFFPIAPISRDQEIASMVRDFAKEFFPVSPERELHKKSTSADRLMAYRKIAIRESLCIALEMAIDEGTF